MKKSSTRHDTFETKYDDNFAELSEETYSSVHKDTDDAQSRESYLFNKMWMLIEGRDEDCLYDTETIVHTDHLGVDHVSEIRTQGRLSEEYNKNSGRCHIWRGPMVEHRYPVQHLGPKEIATHNGGTRVISSSRRYVRDHVFFTQFYREIKKPHYMSCGNHRCVNPFHVVEAPETVTQTKKPTDAGFIKRDKFGDPPRQPGHAQRSSESVAKFLDIFDKLTSK